MSATHHLRFGMACLALLVSAPLAEAALQVQTYGFGRITNSGAPNPASQLSVEVRELLNPSQVEFRFFNNVGVQSSITDVYFDDTVLLAISSISSSAGVSFSQGASPPNLPAGSSLADPFVTTAGHLADSNSPAVPANGVNSAAEWLAITFDLINGKTWADTIAALNGGTDLRIGLHVQAIGPYSKSDSFVNTPSPVPEPGSLVVWTVTALVVGATIRFRRHRMNGKRSGAQQ